MFRNHMYLIYTYKPDLALNNLQWLICYKTKPSHIYLIYIYMHKEDLALNNLQGLICHKTKPNHTHYLYICQLSVILLLGLRIQ